MANDEQVIGKEANKLGKWYIVLDPIGFWGIPQGQKFSSKAIKEAKRIARSEKKDTADIDIEISNALKEGKISITLTSPEQDLAQKNPHGFGLPSQDQPDRETPEVDKQRRAEILILLTTPKRQYKSLGIGVHNGVFYIGTTLEKGNTKLNAIVTSHRKIYVCWIDYDEGQRIKRDEIKEKFGLNYRFSLFDDCIDYSWSNKSINKWLYEEVEPIAIKELYEAIYKINTNLIYHTDKRIHSFVCCDIISNYYYPIFNAKGRTYFQAEFNSGKSRQSRIYHLLSFNPLFASNISPASFERVIESTGGTLIIDNFDNMPEELKGLILQAIEVYYKKGGKNIKADGFNKKPIAFNGYSPLVINNIIGLPEVTESRCNKILMLRTENKEITDRQIKEEDTFWGELRDKLHVSALQNWEQVQRVYQDLKVSELSGRDLEKAEAVLTIAKCIGDDVFNELLSFILENNEQQNIKELSGSWEFILFECLNLMATDEDNTIKVAEITEKVLDKLITIDENTRKDKINEVKLRFSHYAGKILSSIPNFKKSVSGGWVRYSIHRKDLLQIIRIKRFDKYLTNTTNPTDLTNLTNTTNTTHTTNTTLNSVGIVGLGGFVVSEGCTQGEENQQIVVKEEQLVDLPNLIKENDKGDGVSYVSLKDLSGLPDTELEKELSHLSKKGDIFQVKPDLWKILT